MSLHLSKYHIVGNHMPCAHLFILQADGPVLPSDLKGETFSHVFGTNTSR